MAAEIKLFVDIIKALMVHGFVVKEKPSAWFFCHVPIGKADEDVLEECGLLWKRNVGTYIRRLNCG